MAGSVTLFLLRGLDFDKNLGRTMPQKLAIVVGKPRPYKPSLDLIFPNGTHTLQFDSNIPPRSAALVPMWAAVQ